MSTPNTARRARLAAAFRSLTGGWLVGLGLALALTLVPVRPAHACWANVLHVMGGRVIDPPCNKESQAGAKRVRQNTVRLAGKMADLMVEVQQMKAEVRGWQSTIREAQDLEQQMKSLHGDLSVNPIGSLLTVYERSPMLVWVKGADGLRQRIVTTGLGELTGFVQTDLRRRSDSILATYQTPDSLKSIYNMAGVDGSRLRRGDEVFGMTMVLTRQLGAVRQFQADAKRGLDTLQSVGNRFATRYDDASDAGGEAEAKISGMSASLNRLRGTAFETQAMAIQQRLRAIENINQSRAVMETDRVRRRIGSGM